MKAAIIGCGYVGTAVAQRWNDNGFDVLATTTRPERVETLRTVASQVAVLHGTEAERLQIALADRQIVLLCVGPKRGGSYVDTYLSTAQTLAQVLPHTNVQQLIYTSTSSVYGHLSLQNSEAWITEAMSPQPSSDNGRVILETERSLLEIATPQRQVCILRLGGIYGPGRTVEDIYGRVAGTMRAGKGDASSHWVHLSDVIGAIDWACQRQLSGIYNVVQDEIPTVRALIGRVCDRLSLAPVKWEIDWIETPSEKLHRSRLANRKLKETGYQFIHPTFWPHA